MSSFWRAAFRAQYRMLSSLDPLIRVVWRRFGIGNVVELRVRRRDGAGATSRMVGLLRSGNGRYIGHPNGHCGWTRDLDAAREGTLSWPDGTRLPFVAERLEDGSERDRAIRATRQHPFPGNAIYRLARQHVRAAGVYFRLAAPVE